MFRCAQTIERTVESVIRQSFHDWELVAVDDGSPDESAALVEAIAARDRRVRLLRHDSNLGVAKALITGIAASSGEFVATLDSDDVWAATKLEKQVAALDDAGPEYGFAYCPFQRIDAEDRVLFAAPLVELRGWAYLPLLVYNAVGNGSSILMRRSALENVGGFIPDKGAYSSDDLLIQLLIAGNWKVCCVPEYLVGYRMVPGSVSSSLIRGCVSRLRVLDIVEARYPEMPPGPMNGRRAETLAKYALYLVEDGALRGAAMKFLTALRTDFPLVMAGMRVYLRQRLTRLRRRVAAETMANVNYFSPENDHAAVKPLTGPRMQRIRKAIALEAAHRAARCTAPAPRT
jgi:glycosyltransferase involved in cell wall biosynthesis